MANESIQNAFERMWEHTIDQLNDKSHIGHTHDDYMIQSNPTGTGAFSLNRKADTIIGTNSIAMGNSATASGSGSTAIGHFTIASDDYQIAVGAYNQLASDYVFMVGNGTADDARSNAFMVDWDGDIHAGHNIAMPNGSVLYTKNNTDEWRTLIGMNASNHILIGYTSFSNKEGKTVVYGGSESNLVVPITDGYTGVIVKSIDDATYDAHVYPITDGKVALGTSAARWIKIYASSNAIATSDEREKSDIMSIADYPVAYSRDGSGNVFEKLYSKLIPKTYTLNIENTNELHIGFVAQDIIAAMEELGLSEDDLGLIDHSYWTDEETGEEKDRYGLAYGEFIALNTYMIQKQQATIKEQQVQMMDLEERVAQLEELVNSN